MKRATERLNRLGQRVVTVTLSPDEHLLIVREDDYYRLGGQVDDIVRGHVLLETASVSWCSVGQEWSSNSAIELRAATLTKDSKS